MSNVIQFLEAMGGNAAMARMSAEDYANAIAMLDADAPSREALGLRDHTKLSALLNGRTMMMCVVACPDDKPDNQESPGEGEDESEEDKRHGDS